MSRPSPRTSTSGTESVNKWKIPHYYRRSSAASSIQSNGSDNGNGSTPSTPGVNVMSSPKKVLMEDPKKGKKRSVYRSRKNKKNGEMVFVNYTVQDSASEDSTTTTPEIPSTSSSPALNSKKKSSRSRMLKIFGSSKAPHMTGSGSNLMACAENEVMCDPYGSEGSTPTALAKRSYGSFLKYGRFHGTSAHNRKSESAPSLISEEVVPKSIQSPNLVKPALIGGFVGDSPRKVSYLGGATSKLETVESPADPRLTEYGSRSGIESYSYGKAMLPESAVGAKKHSDENDASIAFSKMFTRKRANTGGSMSSSLSIGHNAQEQAQSNASVPSLRKNMSASSISSYSYRSPIRTASPARPRSSTRGSFTHGMSFHTRTESQDAGSIALAGAESFLDSQTTARASCINKHRRKQESISESHRLYSTSASNSTILNGYGSQNVVTPSSSSFVTPPPFTSGFTIPSNASTSSTPSVMDLTHASHSGSGSVGNLLSSGSGMTSAGYHSSFNVSQPILDQDSSSEILYEDSDIPTPADNLGVSIEQEAAEAITTHAQHKVINVANSKIKNFQNYLNIDAFDAFLPHGGSTSSSQGGSILTKSTSSVSENVLTGHWQDQACYSLIDAGSEGIETKGQNCGKVVSGEALKLSSGTNTTDNLNYKAFKAKKFPEAPYKLEEQLQMDFDFGSENSSSFINDQRNLSPEGSNDSGQVGVNRSTPVNGQNSAVTSVVNFSPGTNATMSVEEIPSSGSYHRNFDRLNNHANVTSHPSSTAAQSSNFYTVGQWKAINSDLDAITDSLGISDEMADPSF